MIGSGLAEGSRVSREPGKGRRIGSSGWSIFFYAVLAVVPAVVGSLWYLDVGPNPPLVRFAFADWASFASLYGAYMTAMGFAIAINQLRRIRTSSQAAASATSETQRQIIMRLAVGEYGRAAPICAQAASAIAAERFDAAEARLTLLRLTVSGAKRMADVLDDGDLARETQDIVGRVSLIEQTVTRAKTGTPGGRDVDQLQDELKVLEQQLDTMYTNQRFEFGDNQ